MGYAEYRSSYLPADLRNCAGRVLNYTIRKLEGRARPQSASRRTSSLGQASRQPHPNWLAADDGDNAAAMASARNGAISRERSLRRPVDF